MEIVNLLQFRHRSELRKWLEENHDKDKSCWVVTYISKRPEWQAIQYVEVVEEALCFGWIDSTTKRLPDGRLAQHLYKQLSTTAERNGGIGYCTRGDGEIFRKQ